jgi:4-methyl-5(b-hydroxyethyl)-thiazole monophosphate biosynthesis
MVYILLADGFEDIEAFAPTDLLRRADIPVSLVGVTGETVVSGRDVKVLADCRLADIDRDALEMLVLPGGGKGVDNLRADEGVLDLVRWAAAQGKLIAAICAAPTILAELGLLEGKRAVCYPSCEAMLRERGAKLQPDESVVHDRNLITGRAAGSCVEFGLHLVAMLRGYPSSERVRRDICCDQGFRALT